MVSTLKHCSCVSILREIFFFSFKSVKIKATLGVSCVNVSSGNNVKNYLKKKEGFNFQPSIFILYMESK